MKKKINMKNVGKIAAVGIISLLFIHSSFAADTGKVNVETANLRETADGSSKILELLSVNQEVEIIEKTGDWYKVKKDGITGYLRQDLLTVKGEEQKEENKENTQVTEPEKQPEEQTAEPVAEQPEPEQNENPVETSNEVEEIQLGKQWVADNTKLKIIPVINATNTIEVKKDEEINAVEIMNGWVCIEAQNTKGWIRKEKLTKEQPKVEQPVEEKKEEPKEEPKKEEPQPEKVIKTLFVDATSVNLRKEASTSAEIITKLPTNTAVDVLSEANGWSKVRVSGKEGYISSSLLSTKKQETSRSMSTPRTETKQETSKQETAPAPSKNGESVVAYAKQFIGTKYTYGGSSPSTGFDCSGFTSYVYKHFGISLPRTSGGQSGAGTKVDRSNLAAGDLVIYSGHVAIYVGGGQVIHAPRPGKSVCIVPLNQAASNYITARRVL